MATLTIRDLDESIKKNLRLQAATHGCSMEEEARRILRRVLTDQNLGLGSRILQRFAEIGGHDLFLPPRSTPRPAPEFKEDNE